MHENARESTGPVDELHSSRDHREAPARLGTSGRVALTFFAAAAGYFLWTEHRAHVIEYLPWGILALCPLMHFFMHRDHAGFGSHDSARGSAGTGPRP